MDILRDALDRPQFHQTQVERPPKNLTSETKSKKVHAKTCGCGDRGGYKVERGKCNNEGSLPELVVQYNRGKDDR